ncbi:MAG: cation diffusion facilitator family transporter [Prevotella sp.]
MEKQDGSREKQIYRVTLAGSVINVLLLLCKFVAGILGHSAAMIADAVHSLTDFVTDIIVLVFVRLSSKPRDANHEYGHGKYETLASALIGFSLFLVGVMICYDGLVKIYRAICGEELAQPGGIALVAAAVSILLKEWAFRFTRRVGRRVDSEAVVANAWHHRSDALSSVGTFFGIGGAILLGQKWAVLDPIAALVVSVLIIKAAIELIKPSMDELMEKSLPDEVENEIRSIAESVEGVSEVHHLMTRSIGSHIAMEMHVRMRGDMTLYESHLHATEIERKLRARFGAGTHIGLHVEPLKVNGHYECPS